MVSTQRRGRGKCKASASWLRKEIMKPSCNLMNIVAFIFIFKRGIKCLTYIKVQLNNSVELS